MLFRSRRGCAGGVERRGHAPPQHPPHVQQLGPRAHRASFCFFFWLSCSFDFSPIPPHPLPPLSPRRAKHARLSRRAGHLKRKHKTQKLETTKTRRLKAGKSRGCLERKMKKTQQNATQKTHKTTQAQGGQGRAVGHAATRKVGLPLDRRHLHRQARLNSSFYPPFSSS